ncbi:MAG: TonB family protein [Myxococcota bacterium]
MSTSSVSSTRGGDKHLWTRAVRTSLGLHLGMALAAALWFCAPQPAPRRAIPVRLLPVAAARVNTELLPRRGHKEPNKTRPKLNQRPVLPKNRPSGRGSLKSPPVKNPSRDKGKTVHPSNRKRPSPSALDRLNALAGSWSVSPNSEQARDSAARLNQQLQEDYLRHVQASIQDRYHLPATLGAAERNTLKVILRLRIDSKGRVADASILTPSSNSAFDNAVLRAARQSASFGPPPAHLARVYREKGLITAFCPIDCSDSDARNYTDPNK